MASVDVDDPLTLESGEQAAYSFDCNAEVIGDILARHGEIELFSTSVTFLHTAGQAQQEAGQALFCRHLAQQKQ